MKGQFLVTLDKKLVALVMLVSLVGIGTTIAISFHYANILIVGRTMDHLTGESTTRSDSIKAVLNSKVQQIQVIGTDPMIRNLIKELNEIKDIDALAAKISERRIDFLIQIQAFEISIGGTNDLENVEIINIDGKKLFSLINRKDKTDYKNNQIFLEGLKGPFTKVIQGKTERQLLVVTPIFDDQKNRQVIGVVIVTSTTQSIDQILLNRQGLGATGESYLVNKDGIMISESRFIENAAFNQKVDTTPVAKCLETSQNYAGTYLDYRSVLVFGASNCMWDLVLLVEIDNDEVLKPVSSLREKIIILGATITIVVGIVAYFVSKLLSRPLIKLRNAANKIAGGDFDVRTNIRTRDEIGQLSSSFDQMAEKIQDSLLKIQEREEIIKQQKDILLQFSQYSSNYCVCFVDIVGSTKLTAKLTDIQTSRFYAIFLNSVATIIAENGGVVVKNIGDALLYYFPKTDIDDIQPFEGMLECCTKVLGAREMINKTLAREGLPELSYRLSAMFGPVRVAIVATSSIDDIFGSTVNACSKINSLAAPNTMVIGESLYEKVKNIKSHGFEKLTTYTVDAGNTFAVYSVKPKNH
jgi:class 3 adenylate cyclase